MNIAEKINPTDFNKAINKHRFSDRKTHHGYSFEDAVIDVFGFTDESGNPYRGKHTQDFDIPKSVTQRNSSLPTSLQIDWSIKCIGERHAIGLGTARKQYDAWAKNGFVQVLGVYRQKDTYQKDMIDFHVTIVEPKETYWGNISKEKILSIDPVLNKHLSIPQSKLLTREVNTSRTGVLALRNISRIKDDGKEFRNLQAYVNFGDYFKMVA
jgi:hypothetical protein